MVDVITPNLRPFYADLLDDVFRLRYRVLVDTLGWQIPGIQPGCDKDQFDTDDTIYLIETDPSRTKVIATTRFNPTTKPHLLSEVFADACDLQPYPVSPDIWECSRYVFDHTAFTSKEEAWRTRLRMGIAVTEFCMAAGITHISWLTNQPTYNRMLKTWETRPLGLPRAYMNPDDIYIPAISKTDAAALARQRADIEWADEQITFAYAPITAASVPRARDLAA